MKTITKTDEDYYVTSTEDIIENERYETLPQAMSAALELTKRTGLNHLVLHVVGSLRIETEL